MWTARPFGPARAAERVRVAVICSRYPAVSHTFIHREVRALRAAGLQVDTFAVRRAEDGEVLSDGDREERAKTHALLPAGLELPRAHLRALIAHPLGWSGTLLRGLRLTPGTPRGTLWQLFYFAEAVMLWRELSRRGIRHVHAHFADVASDVALLATDLGNRIDGGGWSWSLALHGPAQLYGVRESRLPAKVADAAFVACVSDHLRSQLMIFTPPEHWLKLHVVRTGVDRGLFAEANGSARPGRVLTVARMVRGKGLDVLLDSLAILRARGVPAEAVLVGDGPERERLERRSRELGLSGQVQFTGAVGHDRIRDLYTAASVFCLPSFSEGIPVVLMEAMAIGLPVVASRITGVPELVEEGNSGLLVAPGRADQLADALGQVLGAGEEARRAMGAAGRRRVWEEFNHERGARRLVQLLASVNGSSGDYST
jgi:colanic acid/amylovoran biosynthesis glycosyltransferase